MAALAHKGIENRARLSSDIEGINCAIIIEKGASPANRLAEGRLARRWGGGRRVRGQDENILDNLDDYPKSYTV